MADAAPLPPSPIELQGARARGALSDAAIWLGLAAAIWLAWHLAAALLLIMAGIVFAAALDAGVRVLGRVWKVRQGLRLAVVVLLFVAALIGFFAFAGVELAAQFAQLKATVTAQTARVAQLAAEFGIQVGDDPLATLKAQIGGSIGQITSVLGSAAGALGGLLLIVTFGIFIAADPRVYERGIAWLTPETKRDDIKATLIAMAAMLRRWVAGRLALMVFEGCLIAVGLTFTGVPLAALLGLVAGLFAFIPNLGALASGALIVAVGFSAGTTTGFYAIGVYLAVQLADNIINPLIEKRAVDLAPAVVLAAQLLFGVLFGIVGVTMADPIVALVKVALTRRDAAP